MPPLELEAKEKGHHHHSTPNELRQIVLNTSGHIHVELSPIQFRIVRKPYDATRHPIDIAKEDILMESRSAFLVWDSSSTSPRLAFRRDQVRFVEDDDKERVKNGREGLKRSTGRPDRPISPLASEYFDLYLNNNGDGDGGGGGDNDDEGKPYSLFAAWTFARNTPLTQWTSKDAPAPDELIVLATSKFPQVWEEDAPMIGSVRNPYHRVDAVATSRHIQIWAKSEDGTSEYAIADTKDIDRRASRQSALALFETGLPTRWYLPESAFRASIASGSSITPKVGAPSSEFPKDGLQTVCPYKGDAYYHTIRLPNGEELQNIAWSYPDPIPALDLRGRIALWTPGNDRLRLLIDGQQVS